VYIDPQMASGMVRTFSGTRTSQDAVALSERESTVLRQIAEGHSNKDIAKQLGLSVKTVETYKARSMEKLGLHSRVDIVRYAAGRGWLRQ